MAVARRRVLYIPGYDPIPPRRYRELYRREGAEQARIAGYALTMGARKDRAGFGWGVTAEFPPEALAMPTEEAGSPLRQGGTSAPGDGMAAPLPIEAGPQAEAVAQQSGQGPVAGTAARSAAQPARVGTAKAPAVEAGVATGTAAAPPDGPDAEPGTTVPGGGQIAAAGTAVASHAPDSRARTTTATCETLSPTPPLAPPPAALHPRRVEAEIEVLVWSDVVAASMGRSIAATYGQLARTAWIYIASGALAAMMRLRRGPVLAALYPVAVLLGQALLALAAAAALGWLAARLLPWWLGLGLAAAAFTAMLIGWKRLDGRLFAHYLMHDYAFTARLRGAYPPELEARIDRFADRLAEVLEGDWDEVLVVGHSSGAYLAVSVLAELARRQPPDPRLALLTLGHVVPMAAFLPRAQRLRGDLAAVSASPVAWIDVTAPGDACSFGLCDPVATCGVEPANRHGPLVLSAAFSQTLSPARLKALRHRWFRLHFQYLCAFDHPERYDYFAITAGPLTLAERFAGRHHSPGRITRAVSPFRDRAP